MVEKLFTVQREKIVQTIGRLTDDELVQLNRTLSFVIGLGWLLLRSAVTI